MNWFMYLRICVCMLMFLHVPMFVCEGMCACSMFLWLCVCVQHVNYVYSYWCIGDMYRYMCGVCV